MSYTLTSEGGSIQPQGHTGIDYPEPYVERSLLRLIAESIRNEDHELALIENTQRIISAEDGVEPALIGGAL